MIPAIGGASDLGGERHRGSPREPERVAGERPADSVRDCKGNPCSTSLAPKLTTKCAFFLLGRQLSTESDESTCVQWRLHALAHRPCLELERGARKEFPSGSFFLAQSAASQLFGRAFSLLRRVRTLRPKSSAARVRLPSVTSSALAMSWDSASLRSSELRTTLGESAGACPLSACDSVPRL